METMDNLEKITYAAVAFLAGCLVFLMATHEPVASIKPATGTMAIAIPRVKLDALAKGRIRVEAFAEKNMDPEVVREYKKILEIAPDSHRDWLNFGWFYLERKDPIKAVINVRRAAKLNSDYMAEKSPDFLGDRLKNLIDLALVRINMKLKDPKSDHEHLKKVLKETYVMQRRFGRGCE